MHSPNDKILKFNGKKLFNYFNYYFENESTIENALYGRHFTKHR